MFRNASIMGGTCPAVCMPSHNMLMTGKSLFRVGGETSEHIPSEHVTLPELLRQNGYFTYHVGKWHQDRASFHRGFCGGARTFEFTPGGYVQYGGHWNCLYASIRRLVVEVAFFQQNRRVLANLPPTLHFTLEICARLYYAP